MNHNRSSDQSLEGLFVIKRLFQAFCEIFNFIFSSLECLYFAHKYLITDEICWVWIGFSVPSVCTLLYSLFTRINEIGFYTNYYLHHEVVIWGLRFIEQTQNRVKDSTQWETKHFGPLNLMVITHKQIKMLNAKIKSWIIHSPGCRKDQLFALNYCSFRAIIARFS